MDNKHIIILLKRIIEDYKYFDKRIKSHNSFLNAFNKFNIEDRIQTIENFIEEIKTDGQKDSNSDDGCSE